MFKKCGHCEEEWITRSEFIVDKTIQLIGYQAHFEELELGLLLFNHTRCKSTLAVKAALFTDLYTGPVFSERKTGQKDCPGFCLEIKNLSPCYAQCECAYIRELFSIIENGKGSESG
jgi:hypothetical protein